ncbi:hypothetical protein [Mesorhizobium sp.]|uniref:hypothetical protein n=1 Tax=Mesorhizobium sp. TaxID=1871066 RepID=UPI0025D76FB0|nr:hypothetical protein [Mesorhizobium sp.]
MAWTSPAERPFAAICATTLAKDPGTSSAPAPCSSSRRARMASNSSAIVSNWNHTPLA